MRKRSHRRRHNDRPRRRIRIPADYCAATGKIAYDSELDAGGHVASLEQRDRVKINVYRCPAHPDHWHVGHDA